MPPPSNREIEIKLRMPDAAHGRRLLRNAGFRVAKRRVLERNTIFDTPDESLRASGRLIRLRTAGTAAILTFKGPSEPGRHKIREEIETEVGDPEAFDAILARLGYYPSFRYEKYRTEYAQSGSSGHAMLDETPIGVFLELEGPARWIDRTARQLGFSDAAYITASYARLFTDAGLRGDMIFEGGKSLAGPHAR